MLDVSVTGNLIQVNLDGKITKEEYKAFEAELQTLANKSEGFRIYADATGMDGAEPDAIWEDLKNIPAYKNVTRFAIVGDKIWMQVAGKLSTVFTKGEIKFFEPGQQEAARRWVEEKSQL